MNKMLVRSAERTAGKISPLGFTPLLSAMSGQTLKYDFRGVGPIAWDKSGRGNHGKLKPRDDPPRRRIQPSVPPEVAMVFDGKDDRIQVPYDRSLDVFTNLAVEAELYVDRYPQQYSQVIAKGVTRSGGFGLTLKSNDYVLWELWNNEGKKGSADARVMSLGERHKIKGEWNGKTVTLVFDGDEVATGSLTGTLTSERPVYIGGNGAGRSFDGMIYNIRMERKV